MALYANPGEAGLIGVSVVEPGFRESSFVGDCCARKIVGARQLNAVGAVTVSWAWAGAFSPVVVTFAGAFVYVPPPVATTFTVKVHEASLAPRSPASPTEVASATAVTVALSQVVAATGGVATFSPVGNVSVNDQPTFSASSVVFVTVNLSCAGWPVCTEAGANSLSSCGVASKTRMSSKAASLPAPFPLPLRSRIPRLLPANRAAPL